jgi:hypothetical protein
MKGKEFEEFEEFKEFKEFKERESGSRRVCVGRATDS